MIISKNWLQTYFNDLLPEANSIADCFNLHAFEIDEINKTENDEIFNIKVLPDRANYALCHRGIAREFAAISGHKMKTFERRSVHVSLKNTEPSVEIEENNLCSRYISREVQNVVIKESPEWLKTRLESIGERSINNIVDVANFVMFDMGQPLHAFDANKIKGKICVRLAKTGERITTLDNKDIELDSNTLIIADDLGPLAIAGIKGGKRAEVSSDTTHLILESANFSCSHIRLTENRLNLKTEASRRFEANLSPEITGEAMDIFSFLINEVSPGAQFGPVKDIYSQKQSLPQISIPLEKIASILGFDITPEDIGTILDKLEISYTIRDRDIIAVPPAWRTDLKIDENIIEEVGRIYGYDKIKPVLPTFSQKPQVNKNFYYLEKLKNILVSRGFNEVYLYSLSTHGVFETIKPLAEDKRFLRDNLSDGMLACLQKNGQLAPLVGMEAIKIFEIGSVFTAKGEEVHLALGVKFMNKKLGSAELEIKEALAEISDCFEDKIISKIVNTPVGAITEFNTDDIIQRAKMPDSYDDLSFDKMTSNKFKPFSPYPAVLRDISVFVPQKISANIVADCIKHSGGEFLVRVDLFDIFEKDERVSYAFHLVFQSSEKTLTDEEVNIFMEKITNAIHSNIDWQVR